MDKVLIILASYNGESYIKYQIDSILNQIDVNIKILVIDDNSIDNTLKIVEEFKDHRINIVRNYKNSGSPALNFLQAIKSYKNYYDEKFDFISLSDQDDIWEKDKIKAAIQSLKLNNASLYASNLILWNTKTNKKSILVKDYKQTQFDFLFEGASAGCTYVLTYDLINIVISIINKHEINKWLYLSHDWLIYFITRLNNKIVFIDHNSYIDYRIHQNNVHGQLNIFSISALFKRFNFILNQWYYIHSTNYLTLLNENSEEYFIYKMYNKNWFTRVWVILKFNFKLIRSRKKFIQFAIVSFFPRFNRFQINIL